MTIRLPGGFVLEEPEKAGPVPPGLPSSFLHLTLPPAGDRKADPMIVANTAINVKRGLPILQLENYKPRAPAIIVGGGPSLADTLDELRAIAAEPGACIICANDSHDFLIANGIVPWGCVFWEIQSSFANFFENARDDVTYLLSAFAHPSAFEKLAGKKIVIFFATQFVGDEKIIADYMREHGKQGMIGGAATAPLRAVGIMLCKGHLRFHLFGVDSSFRDGQSHAYYNREKAGLPIWCAGRMFDTNWYLAKQAENFTEYMKNYGDRYEFVVHGDGLIPHIARQHGRHFDQWKAAKEARCSPSLAS